MGLDLFGVLSQRRRLHRFGHRRRLSIRVCPSRLHQLQEAPVFGPAVPRFLAIHQFRNFSIPPVGYVVHPPLGVSADLQSAVKKCSILFVLRGFEIPVLRGRTFLMPDNISGRTPSGKGRLRQKTLHHQQAFFQLLFEFIKKNDI